MECFKQVGIASFFLEKMPNEISWGITEFDGLVYQKSEFIYHDILEPVCILGII